MKSNQVIEASYTLTTIEQRLILSAIAQIPKGEPVTDEVIYTVSVADLQKIWSKWNYGLSRPKRECEPSFWSLYCFAFEW